MCGFVGVFHGGDEIHLTHSINLLNHRGPDGTKAKWFPKLNYGIAHSRLSIIDLSDQAYQPMHDSQSNNWIVFNGEIYNYSELKKELISHGYSFFSSSDTEVVLKAFDCWGSDCLKKLNGMFSFLIINEISGDVFGARDRLGIKPFYYYCKDQIFIAASEIKSICAFPKYYKEPDYISLITPVHYQVGPNTGFKDIVKLLPGHYLEYKNQRLSTYKWWQIEPVEEKINLSVAIDHLDYLINDAVRLQLISDVPVGLLLSGGLDSSLIGALMKKHSSGSIKAFTIYFSKEDVRRHGNINDLAFARTVAQKFGFEHQEIMIKPDVMTLLPQLIYNLDEPLADPSVINTYLICKAARDSGVFVLQTGMGADEVFAGYRSSIACLSGDHYLKIPKLLRYGIESVVKQIPQSINGKSIRHIRYLKKFLHFAGFPRFERYLSSLNSALTSTDFNHFFIKKIDYTDTLYYKKNFDYFNKNNCSYLTKMCLNDSSFYLPDHNLNYSDKGSMAASVELRPPMLDHRIVEFLFTLQPNMRIRKNVQKFILKKVAEKYLPASIIYRPKAPFSAPLRSWLNGELVLLVDDLLSESNVKKRGIYNPLIVNQLIKRDRSGIEDNSQLIFRLIVSELWFKIHFDNEKTFR